METRHRVVRHVAILTALATASGCGGGGSGGGAGGGSVRALTFPAGVRGGSPRFSPDGSLLAYLREEASVYAVAVMSPTGTDSRTLASDGSYLTAMAWTANGSEIVYYADTTIRAVPAAGGAGRQVVAAFAALDPDLSPDGSRLAYGINGGNLTLADLRTTPPVETDLGVPASSPRFSPDGATLAFYGNGKLSLMNLATRAVTDVLDSSNDFGGVDWFSDGLRLLAGTDRGIEIVILGPPVRRTLVEDVFALMHVDLSPDERSVAYGVNGAAELYLLTGF